MNYYEYITPQNLSQFWQNVKDYYASDIITDEPIHIGDNTTVTTRSLSNPDDHIASTLFVKNYVIDTLVSGGLTSIPVLDVKVNEESVINNQVAEIDIPIMSISVEGQRLEPYNRNVNIPRLINDVVADGKSIIDNKIVTIPLQHISVNDVEIPIEGHISNIIIKRNGEVVEYNDGLDIIVPTQASDIGAVSQDQLNQTNSALALANESIEANKSIISRNASNIISLNSDLNQTKQQLESSRLDIATNAQGIKKINDSIGKPNGIAQLDENGKISSNDIPNLPIETYDNIESLPQPGTNGTIYLTLEDSKVWVWKNEGYEELGGIDAALREQVSAHLKDIENPHKVTKAQLELDQVDNTSDKDKPISDATAAALESKIGVADIIDNLTTGKADKALSAKQGAILEGKIDGVKASILDIGNPLEFKGTVPTYDDLPTSASRGDVYQVQDGDKETYAWNGNEWVVIAVAVTDITKYIATQDEIYGIIDSYVEED